MIAPRDIIHVVFSFVYVSARQIELRGVLSRYHGPTHDFILNKTLEAAYVLHQNPTCWTVALCPNKDSK